MISVRTNMSDLKREIARMGKSFGPVVVRSSLREAMLVFRREVKRRAPVDTGRLRRAIYIKRVKPEHGKEHYFLGIRQGKGARSVKRRGKVVNLDAYYWRYLEAGWIPRRKSGDRSVVRYPFIGPAFDAVGKKAVERFFAVADRRIMLWRERG